MSFWRFGPVGARPEDSGRVLHEGAPIGIDMPPSLELTVTQTEPSLKGATVSNVNKPATLENGVIITVPPFVNEGDRIRVDPIEGRYIERAK